MAANWQFEGYYEALSNLGAEYVRYSPWFMNPRAVVPELTPSDCTKTKPATNWNSTYFDGIMRDFMAAVCGPNAEDGQCKHSVVQQLSTMPSWLYEDGACQHGATSCLPLNPWNTPVSMMAAAVTWYTTRVEYFAATYVCGHLRRCLTGPTRGVLSTMARVGRTTGPDTISSGTLVMEPGRR
jgi:hypothetical protein